MAFEDFRDRRSADLNIHKSAVFPIVRVFDVLTQRYYGLFCTIWRALVTLSDRINGLNTILNIRTALCEKPEYAYHHL